MSSYAACGPPPLRNGCAASPAAPRHHLSGRMMQLVRLVAEIFGGSAVATVTADLGDGLKATWRWPEAARDGGNPAVRHPLRRGERIRGELTVQPDPWRPATPVEQRLLDDAADLAGLLVESTRLDQTLQSLVTAADQRNRDLEESRRRVLVALEGERRRLERDIHDGAQQHLVALAVNLRLLKVLVTKDPPRAQATAAAVRSALLEAVHTLERLSVGLYPAVLTESGPAAALRAAAAASPVAVTVHADVRRRWPVAAERAAYFGCLEALQNAVKHAAAQRIVVILSEVGGGLSFEVTDDGRGFDPANATTGSGTVNLADRIAGAGGRLTVISTPGRGTTVSGWVPTAVPLDQAQAA